MHRNCALKTFMYCVAKMSSDVSMLTSWTPARSVLYYHFVHQEMPPKLTS